METIENARIKDRVAKLEADLKLIAKGFKAVHELIADESGEEIFEPGDTVQGIKLA